MAIERISPFDFSAGGVTLLPQARPEKLPAEDLLPPVLAEMPVVSKLQELFQGNQLEHLELDSMDLPPETLKVLARESLKSLISDIRSLLTSASGIAPTHEISRVAEMLDEELMNQELLAAFRRAILGG